MISDTYKTTFRILELFKLEHFLNIFWVKMCTLSFRSREVVPDFLHMRQPWFLTSNIKFIYLSEQNLLPTSINIHLHSVVQACACCAWVFWSKGSVTLLGLTPLSWVQHFPWQLAASSCLLGQSEDGPVLEAVSWGRCFLRDPQAQSTRENTGVRGDCLGFVQIRYS